MAASPWTYFRGAAAVMAADLASRPDSGLTVQMCGDAHVLNFGLWATPERPLSFDLRDFDETLPGPFEWDLMRMVTSLQVLARDAGLTNAKEADRAVRRPRRLPHGIAYAEAGSSTSGTHRSRRGLSASSWRGEGGHAARLHKRAGSGRTSRARRSSPRWSTVVFAWSRHRRSASG
jgi:uncharacterized protein (DUF2252 family)